MVCLMHPLSRSHGERGASLVELALIAPVMMLLVFGVLDLTRAYRMQIRLENAAREGAAFAENHPNDVDCAGDDDIQGHVMAEDDSLSSLTNFTIEVWTDTEGTSDMALPITGCGGTYGDRGDRVRVDVRSDFAVMTPMIQRIVGSTIEITGSAMVEVPR